MYSKPKKYKLLLEILKGINVKSCETLRMIVIFELNNKYTFMRLKKIKYDPLKEVTTLESVLK